MNTDDGTLSLVTFGYFMNTTTGNQGNHCVIAICQSQAHPVVDQGNQSLITQPCERYTAVVAQSLPQLREALSQALGTAELALGGAG